MKRLSRLTHSAAGGAGTSRWVRCERWGLEMKGYVSRAAVIACSSDLFGYNTIRNDETRRFTDTLIADFVETKLKKQEQQLSSAAG